MDEYARGDFVDVHFPDGCKIGRVVDVCGDEVTVSFDNAIMYGIPKRMVTLWLSMQN